MLFLDCTWQIMSQFPAAFEFTESFLIMLADHYQSAWFGNFLMDCERQRLHSALAHRTTSIWSHVRAVRNTFLNKDYAEIDGVLYPGYSAKQLQFWSGYFLRHEQAALASKDRTNNVDEDIDFGDHNTVVWVSLLRIIARVYMLHIECMVLQCNPYYIMACIALQGHAVLVAPAVCPSIMTVQNMCIVICTS